MYEDKRDRIYYHDFFRSLREWNKVSQNQVCKGICTASGMNRFEKGNRMVEKMVIDRFTARLGISNERFEDYLRPKEYVRWEHRRRIVQAIEQRMLQQAKQELDDYQALDNHNCVNLQFIEAMRYMIHLLEGAPEEELSRILGEAIALTVQNVKKALEGKQLLCDQEINLIMEQIRLSMPENPDVDAETVRVLEYESIIAYIDSSKWENLQKAKVYPKVVYYLCKELSKKEASEAEIRRGLELCQNSIELLRETSRLYYFLELLQIRRILANRLMKMQLDEAEREKLEDVLCEDIKWERMFLELYTEYDVKPYIEDFCYLYYEAECHNAVQIMEIRRKMFHISRNKLVQNICTRKTIIRYERMEGNPTIEIIRLLFEKLHLYAECRRASVVTDDAETFLLSLEVMQNMNDNDLKNLETNLKHLEKKLCMNIPYNKQEILRLNTMLQYKRRELDSQKIYERLRKSLIQTVPMRVLEAEGKKYFTRSEMAVVAELAFQTYGKEAELCRNIIEDRYVLKLLNEEADPAEFMVYESVMGETASYYGRAGAHEKSDQISKQMIKNSLRQRRLGSVAEHLYNRLWNYKEVTAQENWDVSYMKEMLDKCYLISKIIRREDHCVFFWKNELK